MEYHEYPDGQEEILNRNQVNLKALFFAVAHHIGLKLNLSEDTEVDVDVSAEEPLEDNEVRGTAKQ